jgi:O-antigen/teichoic acid export membrane protein
VIAGSLRRSVSRGAGATLVLRAGSMALAGIAAIVLARTLGPAGYGTYAWASAWVVALSIPAALGADQLLVREAGVALDSGAFPRLRALVRAALATVVLVALAAALLVLLGALVAGGGSSGRRSALLVALPILPLAAVAAVAQGVLLGLGRTTRALAPGTVVRQGVFLTLVLALTAAGALSASGAVALQLAATATATAIVLVLLWRELARGPRAGAPGRGWLRESLPMGAATMFLAIDAQVGLLVLGATGQVAEAGVFAAALLCTAPFSLLLGAGRLPLMAAVARLGTAGERERLQRGLRTATRALVLLSAPIAALVLLAPGLVLGLFGGDFSEGATALRLLAIAHIVNVLAAFNGTVLIMRGHERAAMTAAFGGLVLDAMLCVVLVPPLGATGAAIALLVSITARNVVNAVQVRRRLGIDATVVGRMPAGPAAPAPPAEPAAPSPPASPSAPAAPSPGLTRP